MRTTAWSLAGATAVALATAGGPGSAQDRCSRESFSVDGGAISVVVCGSGTPAAPAVSETFTRGSDGFTRTLPISLVAGASVSRAVDDVPLDRLGIAKRLHLTIAYQNGAARIEHAMLLPGAIVLK